MRLILSIVFILLISVKIIAEDRGFDVILKEMKGESRMALVIGNRDYRSLHSLKNPINDVRDMAKILRKKGFFVFLLENASQWKMEQEIIKFSKRIRREKGVGLFYYAGHGVEVEGVNYLIPSDVRIPSIDFVKSKTVSVDSIISSMEHAQNRFNILILDACRSNPFGRGGGGLAPVNSATGIYVAYATAPSKIAEDGAGKNGLFTLYLKKYINQSGLKIEEVFKKVRRAVRRASDNRQTPWSISSVEGDFYFTLPTLKSKPKPQSVIETPTSKWITPLQSVCKRHGGAIDRDGLCRASWKNAKKICSDSGAILPSKKVFEQIITDCGGVLNNSKRELNKREKNKHNMAYQSCYKRQGFSTYYWSSTATSYNPRNAWIVYFYSATEVNSNKKKRGYVRCTIR